MPAVNSSDVISAAHWTSQHGKTAISWSRSIFNISLPSPGSFKQVWVGQEQRLQNRRTFQVPKHLHAMPATPLPLPWNCHSRTRTTREISVLINSSHHLLNPQCGLRPIWSSL
jgi:hypothetical protein